MNIYTKEIKAKCMDEEISNIVTNVIGKKKYLGLRENKPLTNSYYEIESLGDDHYAVCELVYNTHEFLSYDNFIDKEHDVKASFKWGIIRLKRNEKGNIMPFKETLVFPFVYDRIAPNNEKTATAYVNNHLVYLDLDKTMNYGKQLSPAILDHAAPFNITFKGFAECSINGKIGYIPRNIKFLEHLDESYLLDYDQVMSLMMGKPTMAALNLYSFLTKDEQYKPLIRKRIPRY